MSASRTPRRRLPVLLGTAALGVALAGGLSGCGSESSDSASDPTPSATTSASDGPSDGASGSPAADGPACADVWSDGGSLPGSYRGCVDDTGTLVKADALGCSSGQRIITYGDRFYGVPGGTIHMTSVPLLKDHDYRAALRRCRA